MRPWYEREFEKHKEIDVFYTYFSERSFRRFSAPLFEIATQEARSKATKRSLS